MNCATIKPACESVEKLSAVKRVIRGTVFLQMLRPIAEFDKFPRLQVTRIDSRRLVSNSGNLVANPDRLQRLDRLRTRIHSSAYLAQLRSRLENLRLYPKGFKRVRGSKSGEPAANDRYPTV